MVHFRFRRVDVFRLSLIGFKDTRAESDYFTVEVMNRKDYASTETVIVTRLRRVCIIFLFQNESCFFKILFLVAVGGGGVQKTAPFIKAVAQFKFLYGR